MRNVFLQPFFVLFFTSCMLKSSNSAIFSKEKSEADAPAAMSPMQGDLPTPSSNVVSEKTDEKLLMQEQMSLREKLDVGTLFAEKTQSVPGEWEMLKAGHHDLRVFVHKSPKQRQHIAVARISKLLISTLVPKDREILEPERLAGNCPVAINGGYFSNEGSAVSLSILASHKKVDAVGVTSVARSLGLCRPARATFAQLENGYVKFGWAKVFNDKIFVFKNVPDPYTSYTQTDGVEWSVQWAMGGGPMLLKDKQNMLTLDQECFSLTDNVAYPRTGVAIANDLAYFLAADGDTDSYDGLTFTQMREMFVALGATDAMAFDGGASTAFVVAGKMLNLPNIPGRRIYSMMCLN